MGEAAASTPGSGRLADPLGEFDDRLDQLLPVEQREVVVVRARDLHDTRLPGRRCATARLCSGGTIESREP